MSAYHTRMRIIHDYVDEPDTQDTAGEAETSS